MGRCAFLTMDDLEGFHSYDDLVHPHLRELGWTVENLSWRARGIDWSAFDLVVIRSTWDYQEDPGGFLAALARIEASGARLENPLPVVRWNLDKRYLLALEVAGVPLVPTRAGAAGTLPRPEVLRAELGAELVIKPAVSANADHTYRLRPGDDGAGIAAAFRERAWLAQPFVPSIESAGEISLFYFAGRYSHAVRKRPAPGDFRVQEEHGGRISPLEPGAAEHAAAEAALAAAPGPLLYARVDLVDHAGAPALMELELIEPSLYFNLDPESPRRFATAVAAWSQRAA